MTESVNKSQSLDAKKFAAAFPELVGNSAQDLEIIQLAGDASTRSYFRVVKNNSLATSSRISWILQCAESFDLNSTDKHAFLAGHRILDAVQVRIPKILALSGLHGWIVMEDLSDETLQLHREDHLYRQALDLLIEWTLKAHPENPHLPADVKKMPQFSWAFDTEKLEFEMGFTEEHLFKRFLGLDGSTFRLSATPNSKYLSAQPRFYCHRDYHCRNLMYFDERLAVIDFQDARMGPITYDVVSLLWDPYVRLSEKSRAELLGYWKEKLLERAQGLSWLNLSHLETAFEGARNWRVELERMKIQRLLKAAGSYASFFNNKGRKDYLPSTFGALDDTLAALDNLLTVHSSFALESDRQLRVEVGKLQNAFAAKMDGFL